MPTMTRTSRPVAPVSYVAQEALFRGLSAWMIPVLMVWGLRLFLTTDTQWCTDLDSPMGRLSARHMAGVFCSCVRLRRIAASFLADAVATA